MGTTYRHLSIEARESIMVLRAQNASLQKIADTLGYHKSTISRKLKRNSIDGQYRAIEAQRQYDTRREFCKQEKKLKSEEYRLRVQEKLVKEQWSPE